MRPFEQEGPFRAPLGVVKPLWRYNDTRRGQWRLPRRLGPFQQGGSKHLSGRQRAFVQFAASHRRQALRICRDTKVPWPWLLRVTRTDAGR